MKTNQCNRSLGVSGAWPCILNAGHDGAHVCDSGQSALTCYVGGRYDVDPIDASQIQYGAIPVGYFREAEKNFRTEIERLTKERDEARAELMHSRALAERRERQRDELREKKEFIQRHYSFEAAANLRAENSGLRADAARLETELTAAKADAERLRERLQFDPGGSDKIDELEAAVQMLRAEVARLTADLEQVNGDTRLAAKRVAAEQREAIARELMGIWVSIAGPLAADVRAVPLITEKLQ